MQAPTGSTELGSLVAEYRRTATMCLGSLAWLVPLLAGAVALMTLLAFGYLRDLFQGWVRPAMIAGLMPVIWLLGTSVVHVIRNWNLRVSLHRLGMAQSTWRGEESIRWDQVAQLWMRGDRDVRLRLLDGSDVVVDGVTWTDEPVQRIASLTLAEMLPAASETLRRGGRLDFGPIAVTREALEVRGSVIPWADVELRPGLHGGMLTIRDRGTGRMEFVAIRDVPNAHVLRAVLPETEEQE